jgi:hypothetical protein
MNPPEVGFVHHKAGGFNHRRGVANRTPSQPPPNQLVRWIQMNPPQVGFGLYKAGGFNHRRGAANRTPSRLPQKEPFWGRGKALSAYLYQVLWLVSAMILHQVICMVIR